MPSSPKVCNRLCDVGIVKVFKKLESHHIAKTASHIGVTREIKVNLECIGYHTHPCSDNTVFIGCCKNVCCERSHGVCDNYLFGKTDHKELYTLCEHFKRFTAVYKLFGNITVTDNRTCNKLRKKCNISTEVYEVLRHWRIITVNINNIAHCLECVEADADRQADLKLRNIEKRQHIERFGYHSRIFKHRKNTYIKHAGKNQKQLFLFGVGSVFVNKPTAYVVEEDVEHHKQNKLRFAPTVEYKVYDKEKNIASLPWHKIVSKQGNRQIRKHKYKARKYHSFYPPANLNS